jgi:hypothetical protein
MSLKRISHQRIRTNPKNQWGRNGAYTFDLGPAELAVLQSLGEEAHARAVPEDQLDAISPLRAKDINRAVEGIALHRLTHQRRETLRPLAEVDRGFVATITRTAPVGPIIWRLSTPGSPQRWSSLARRV